MFPAQFSHDIERDAAPHGSRNSTDSSTHFLSDDGSRRLYTFTYTFSEVFLCTYGTTDSNDGSGWQGITRLGGISDDGDFFNGFNRRVSSADPFNFCGSEFSHIRIPLVDMGWVRKLSAD